MEQLYMWWLHSYIQIVQWNTIKIKYSKISSFHKFMLAKGACVNLHNELKLGTRRTMSYFCECKRY